MMRAACVESGASSKPAPLGDRPPSVCTRLRVAHATAAAEAWAPTARRVSALRDGVRRNTRRIAAMAARAQSCRRAGALVPLGGGGVRRRRCALFRLSSEPSLWPAIAFAVLSVAASPSCCGAQRRRACDSSALMLAAACLGFAAAKLRTESVAAPVIPRELGPSGSTAASKACPISGHGQRASSFAPVQAWAR